MIRFFTVILAGGLLFVTTSIFNHAQAQFKQDDYGNYTDTIRLRSKASFKGFELLDSVVPNYDVFITGENHTFMTTNSALWVKTIKYLHKHAGVKTVMIEYGQASGWLINKYLQTGDTSLFKILKNYAFKEYADSYEDLMKFNKTLEEGEKISLIGIDLERGVYSAVKVMSILIPEDKTPHDSIDLHIESLLGLAAYQDREIFKNGDKDGEENEDEDYSFLDFEQSYSVANTLDLIMANFDVHKEHYKTFLDTNYNFFEKTIRGLQDVRSWKQLENQNTTHNYIFREKYMYNNFVEAYNTTGGKFYGQFGRCHATQKMADKNGCNWYHFKSFGNRLRESNRIDLRNKILTIGILYEDDDYTGNDWEGIQEHVDSLFTMMEHDRVKLYDLKEDGALNTFFKEDFNYVLLNTTDADEDHPYMALDDFDFDFESSTTGKIVYSYGSQTMDLDGLNQLFLDIGATSYSDKLVVHALEMINGSSLTPAFQSHSYFGWIRSVTIDVANNSSASTSSKLGGFIFRSTSFYNLLPKSKAFDIMGGLSLGYSQLTLQMDRTISTNIPNLPNGFIGEKNISKFTNPGLTWGLAGLIDINLSHFTIGALIGFQRDFSNTEWRAGELLTTGPKTDLGGPYMSTRIGFNF